MVRRRLAIVTFIITAVVAANPVLLRVPFSNRRGLAAALDAAPDPRGYYPEYRAFLADVRADTTVQSEPPQDQVQHVERVEVGVLAVDTWHAEHDVGL